MLKEDEIMGEKVVEGWGGMGGFVDWVLDKNGKGEIMGFEKEVVRGKIVGDVEGEEKVGIEGLEKIEKGLNE